MFPKIAQVWYLKSKGCYKKMPVCLWSIRAVHQGLFLSWALTPPLTVPAAGEAPSPERLPGSTARVSRARAVPEPGNGHYRTLHFPEQPQPCVCCPSVWAGRTDAVISQQGRAGVTGHVHCPPAQLGASLLSQPFLTPILELCCSWGCFFLIVEVESCVSKKSLSTFLVLSTVVV